MSANYSVLRPRWRTGRISTRQKGFRVNRAVSRDATSRNQQHAECKWVGDKRSKILGKLLLYLDFIFGQDRAGIPSTRRDRSSDRTLALALPHASIFPFNSSV